MCPQKKILVTRPRHDPIVEYLFYWTKDIIKFAKDHDFRVLDCKAEGANKDTVSNYLDKQNPKFVVFNGHGTDEIIKGHQNKALIESGDNENLLNKKIVYAVACRSAAKLGEDICNNGAEAFIGYSEEFGFISDETREGTPNKDKFDKPFKKASNSIAFAILKGNTVGEAFKKSQKTYNDLIKEYSTSTINKEHKEIRFWLFWDKKFQKMIGNQNATI